MIYQRHADRPVDRMLFFVEPDPEADDKVTPPEVRAAEPNFLETALASLSSLPSYESILDEIRSIDGHNRKIDLFDAVFGQTEGLDRTEPPPMQWSLYHRARVHRLMDDVSDELDDGAGGGAAVGDGHGGGAGRRPRGQRALLPPAVRGQVHRRRHAAPGRVKQPAVEVDALDVDFVRRAFYFWIYRLYDRLSAQPENANLRRLISFLSDRIDMLLFLDAQVELALDRLGPAPTFAAVVAALTDALSGPAALGAMHRGAGGHDAHAQRSPAQRRRRHRALRRDLSRAGRDRRGLGAVAARGGARVAAAAVAGVSRAARPGHRLRRHRRLSPLRRLALPVGLRRRSRRDRSHRVLPRVADRGGGGAGRDARAGALPRRSDAPPRRPPPGALRRVPEQGLALERRHVGPHRRGQRDLGRAAAPPRLPAVARARRRAARRARRAQVGVELQSRARRALRAGRRLRRRQVRRGGVRRRSLRLPPARDPGRRRARGDRRRRRAAAAGSGREPRAPAT